MNEETKNERGNEETRMKTLKGERKLSIWSENPMGCLVKVHEGCAHCGTDLWVDRTIGEELRADCESCGNESAVTLWITAPTPTTRPNRTAIVRLPYGCSEWARVESSNLDAAGVRGLELIVRFKSGVVYAYQQAVDLFEGLVASESKGKFFNQEIKPKRVYHRLCEVYGCLNGVSLGAKCCNVHRR